jgi:hypothetical protein
MSGFQYLSRTVLLCRDYVLSGLSDQEISHRFESVQVLCVSDLHNLSSHAGQVAIITLVSLLSRMGMQVRLSLPDACLFLPQPPLLGSSIIEVLTGSSRKLTPNATVIQNDNSPADLTFALGNSKVKNGRVPCWRLSGDDWNGGLSLDREGQPHAFTREWPIGSMVSAALAAGEAFKFVMRRMPLRNAACRVFFEMSATCGFKFDAVPVPEQGVDFGDVDVISAGAISQAILYVLTRLPRVQISARVFDDDVTAASNLNRNMLTLIDDVGLPKVVVAANSCNPKLRLEAIRKHFSEKISESRKLAARVLVGVDDIPSRWEVQRCAPAWLAVGGTSHFSVSSSSHEPDEPCCGCLHPADESDGTAAVPIATVSFVSFWAGLVTAVRLIRASLCARGVANRQQLWLTPLRMDLPSAAMWMPVAPHRECPVKCSAARAIAVR